MTLQEHYNLIKENKGHKDVFLRESIRLFPNYVLQRNTYDEAVKILKSKNIIWDKKEEVIHESFSDFKNKLITEDIEDVKSDSKKISKYVEETQSHNYPFTNKELIDNIYGQQFLNGYYCEMNDEKNLGKTRQELINIVSKNLIKDSQYYLKNGMFGVKGLGYSNDSPGLNLSKTDKMVPVDKDKIKQNVDDSLGLKEAKRKPKKLDKITYKSPKGKGVKKMEVPKEKMQKISINESLSKKQHASILDEFKTIERNTTSELLKEKINILNKSIKESYLKYKSINESSSEFIDIKKIKSLKESIQKMISERNKLKEKLTSI